MGTGELGAALEELRALLGDRLATSRSVLDHHGRDESPLPAAPPDAVVFPVSTREVAEILAVCNRHRVPVVPFGAGTSLEGHVLATAGGVSLDLGHMNDIVAVRVQDMDATVQAGVTRKALNARLARDGLFFPVDPGADATIGGMAATGASGTTTVRYGAMRENVLALEVVLADGRVIHTAHRARKSSAGYDLTRLFVGSEGTLGVITEVTVRTYGIPETIGGAVCRFADVGSAVEAVTTILQTGVPVARIELLDESAIAAINAYSGLSYPVAPLLLLEFHGSPVEVADQVRNAGEIASEHGAADYRTAIDAGERAKLWRARHDAFYASLALRPGSRAVTTDVCVPISRLAECITATREDIARLGLTTTIVGHVGDGNFHVVALVDPEDPAEMKAAEEMNHRLVERALAMEGTCTGEHGIGLRKMSYLPLELPGGVEVMRQIKRALDPNGILNPGKVLDVDG
ncbi:MAG: FAD-binding protein [Actinomycetota bacterium]|nr:FAD-binding protein [Actinomycetota bacterium]